jgi:CheY-like chemotaxis protein
MAKLLIVDDDQAMLRLYRARFPEGWELIPTDEPEQTLALALEHKPDAILLDLMMPKFSGLQLCESLHTLSYTSRIPIFVVSGYGAAQYKEQCEKLGARAFFQKPVNFNALKSALADEIQGKLTSPNFRSVSYPQFVMVSIENPLEPPCVDGRFDAHPSGTWKRCVEALYVIILMFQAAFDNLARAGIKHGDLLCAGVKITAYNNHRSAPFLRALVSQPQPSLLARREPTTLSDQLLRS